MRVYGLLGLAAKKGSVVSGGSACERVLKSGADGLLIIAGDASDNTKRKFLRFAGALDIAGTMFGACSELGRRVGKSDRSVVFVTDCNIVYALRELLGFAVNENGGV